MTERNPITDLADLREGSFTGQLVVSEGQVQGPQHVDTENMVTIPAQRLPQAPEEVPQPERVNPFRRAPRSIMEQVINAQNLEDLPPTVDRSNVPDRYAKLFIKELQASAQAELDHRTKGKDRPFQRLDAKRVPVTEKAAATIAEKLAIEATTTTPATNMVDRLDGKADHTTGSQLQAQPETAPSGGQAPESLREKYEKKYEKMNEEEILDIAYRAQIEGDRSDLPDDNAIEAFKPYYDRVRTEINSYYAKMSDEEIIKLAGSATDMPPAYELILREQVDNARARLKQASAGAAAAYARRQPVITNATIEAGGRNVVNPNYDPGETQRVTIPATTGNRQATPQSQAQPTGETPVQTQPSNERKSTDKKPESWPEGLSVEEVRERLNQQELAYLHQLIRERPLADFPIKRLEELTNLQVARLLDLVTGPTRAIKLTKERDKLHSKGKYTDAQAKHNELMAIDNRSHHVPPTLLNAVKKEEDKRALAKADLEARFTDLRYTKNDVSADLQYKLFLGIAPDTRSKRQQRLRIGKDPNKRINPNGRLTSHHKRHAYDEMVLNTLRPDVVFKDVATADTVFSRLSSASSRSEFRQMEEYFAPKITEERRKQAA